MAKDPKRKPTPTADFAARAKAAGQEGAEPVFTLISESVKQRHYRDQFKHDYYIGLPGSVTVSKKGGK